MKMQKSSNIVKIEYDGDATFKGTAFILPALNNECMFLITAHHIFDYSQTILFDSITIWGMDNTQLFFDYDSDYITNKDLDICILKLKFIEGYDYPIISATYEKEKALMIGFPSVLSNANKKYHTLNCEIEEVDKQRLLVKVSSEISNFLNDEHTMLEGFSGCPFISNFNDDNLYFLGMENQTATEDTSYNLVEGISACTILMLIIEHYYGSTTNIEDLFKIQDLIHHYINTSKDENIIGFRNALRHSRISIEQIDDVIGKDYYIDRSVLINRIASCNSKYITIYGEAGSGKSVLAKKVTLEKEYVLFARAEQFINEKYLDDIWKFDVFEVIKRLNGINIYFVIDALEFIADRSDRCNLLLQLYDLVNNNNNVSIISTCRESDRSAFLQLNSKYDIQCFVVNPISEQELEDLSTTFDTIKQMKKAEQYCQLLKSPFYINMIIRNNITIEDINGQISFRDLIYKKIICLSDKRDNYSLSAEEIKTAINDITFRRAKEFLLGIHVDEINSNVFKALKSEGVIVERSDYVRLRYDVFEDIVFEHEFDKLFGKCKCDYDLFYNSIKEFGRCVYRRYQIWIGNKLFVKKSGFSFIYHLLFENNSNIEWNTQTIIGIVKSEYCIEFFNDFKDQLVAKGLVKQFIDIINLYAFSIKEDLNNTIQLTPVGKARGIIISLIKEYSLLQSVDESGVINLCWDYSLTQDRNSQYSLAASLLIQQIIDSKSIDGKTFFAETEYDRHLLLIMYNLADVCMNWINDYFDSIINYYRNGDSHNKRLSEVTIRFTLMNTTDNLAENNFEKLAEIASVYWKEDDDNHYYQTDMHRSNNFGLNQNAKYYRSEFRTIASNKFIICMLKKKFEYTLQWIINFVNSSMETQFENAPSEVSKVSIFFADENYNQVYYSSNELWLMGLQEYAGHCLLSDLIYWLKFMILLCLDQHKEDTVKFEKFANSIKTILYAKSNNIALLSIIEEIGLHFSNELPGYALDLASSINIIKYDYERSALYDTNEPKRILEEQILKAVFIPQAMITKRYILDEKCKTSLNEYFLRNYFAFEHLRNKCNMICDYLYAKYPDNAENSSSNFQIQKMDGRKSAIHVIDDNLISVSQTITGNARQIVIEHDKQEKYTQDLSELIEKCNLENEGNPNYDYINSTIDYITNLSERRLDIQIRYENFWIALVCLVLKNDSTINDRKEYLCNIWLNKIEGIFNHHYPTIKAEPIIILLDQIYSSISESIKNRIKAFVLRCIINNQDDGVIDNYANIIISYLNKNKKLAKNIFSTLLMLSLASRKNAIQETIEQYLYNEAPVRKIKYYKRTFVFEQLALITKCGLDIDDDSDFSNAISVLLKMLDSKIEKQRSLDQIPCSDIIVSFMQRQIQKNALINKAIDMLFKNVSLKKESDIKAQLYIEIFSYSLSSFFDGHRNFQMRENIKLALKYLETKINSMKKREVKINLYKALLLCGPQYSTGDWSNIFTEYSIMDKAFLNNQLKQYGKYHFSTAIYSMYKLQFEKLLPEILLGISEVLSQLSCNTQFISIMHNKENQYIIDSLISIAFLRFSDEIKFQAEICNAFESILKFLISTGNKKAAVILDEFRVH